MEQHAIPQQISSYQFRLVGDMTLKQFFQVAAGALVAILFYSTPLHPLIKWPIIIFSFSMGAALAFLPFQERPLSIWIVSFFRSIYSPTMFLWKSSVSPVSYFTEETSPALQTPAVKSPRQIELESYLEKTPDQKSGFLSSLEAAEQNFLSNISKLLGGSAAIFKRTEAPKPLPKMPDQKPASPAAPNVEIPLVNPVSIATKGFRPKIVIEERQIEEEETTTNNSTTGVSPTLQTNDGMAYNTAQFSIDAAPPNPPTIPNTIVGQVMDSQGKIIEGAILEIKDIAGRPVRALRSNKVGHFMIVTSLDNGQYEISTDKEGYLFEPISFVADGKLIPPIAIKANTTTSTQINDSQSGMLQIQA